MKYIMALDEGTTSVRTIIYDKKGNILSLSQKEFTQIYPKAGWVEHDPMEILNKQIETAKEALEKINLTYADIDSIGITNQRETTIVWDKNTGEPVYNAIVWQCRRTSDYADKLIKDGYNEKIRNKTGLNIDAYFSGTKVKWILDNIDGVRERANKGDLLFGTIETWLIWNLTKGKVHITDYSNASRTMLFNIKELKWDKEILDLLDIPENMLPKAMPSSYIYGETDSSIFGGPIKIAGAAGDQQCALFGQTCFKKGEAKNTYGTGAFLLMNVGNDMVLSENGLLTTIAWGLDNKVTYALEGSVYVCGAAIQWLRDELNILEDSKDSEKFALSVEDSNGCYVVPAFVGLGSPYWDQYARGAIMGLTRGVNKYHLVRATLESLAYQVKDLVEAMNDDLKDDNGVTLTSLKVDGGASNNDFLMQFQSDMLDKEVKRPRCTETTSLGASYLAGLATGYFKSTDDILSNWQVDKVFNPNMDNDKRNRMYKGWKKAVSRVREWDKEDNE